MFSWRHLALVLLGGALGTAARAGVQVALAGALGPFLVPLINVVGAFLLGVITGALMRRADTARARAVRQFAGAGVMGGFTTYSALAVEAASDPALLLLGLVSAAAGTAAAGAGLLLAHGRERA